MHLFLFLFSFLALLTITTSPAHADCTSPAAVEGAMNYDSAADDMEFCDGTNWQSMKDTTNSVIWADGGSGKRYYNGGNVGIGVADPQKTAHIKGNAGVLGLEGSNHVFIEFYPDLYAGGRKGYIGFPGTTTDKIYLNNEFGAGIELVLSDNGNVGVGEESPSQKLEVAGNVLATAYFHSSDERLKENIETSSGLNVISKLRGVTYDWKKDGKASAGVIAQEIEKILPAAVATDNDGMKSVEYDQIIAPLIEAVKELKAENDALKSRLDKLEQK